MRLEIQGLTEVYESLKAVSAVFRKRGKGKVIVTNKEGTRLDILGKMFESDPTELPFPLDTLDLSVRTSRGLYVASIRIGAKTERAFTGISQQIRTKLAMGNKLLWKQASYDGTGYVLRGNAESRPFIAISRYFFTGEKDCAQRIISLGGYGAEQRRIDEGSDAFRENLTTLEQTAALVMNSCYRLNADQRMKAQAENLTLTLDCLL